MGGESEFDVDAADCDEYGNPCHQDDDDDYNPKKYSSSSSEKGSGSSSGKGSGSSSGKGSWSISDNVSESGSGSSGEKNPTLPVGPVQWKWEINDPFLEIEKEQLDPTKDAAAPKPRRFIPKARPRKRKPSDSETAQEEKKPKKSP